LFRLFEFFTVFFELPFSHYPDHSAFSRNILVNLLASSSTTSSPASPSLPRLLHLLQQADCIDTSTSLFFYNYDRCGGLLCCFHRQWRVWLYPLPCTSGIGNISTYPHPRRVLGKPGTSVATTALTSSSTSIFLPDDYLDA